MDQLPDGGQPADDGLDAGVGKPNAVLRDDRQETL